MRGGDQSDWLDHLLTRQRLISLLLPCPPYLSPESREPLSLLFSNPLQHHVHGTHSLSFYQSMCAGMFLDGNLHPTPSRKSESGMSDTPVSFPPNRTLVHTTNTAVYTV